MNRLKSNKGFTLIEIMIVFSLIGILFMLLVPQVNSFFTKSHETGIRTDFRSFQQSAEMYLGEFLGVTLDETTLNKFMDSEHEISLSGAVLQTKSKDPWGNPYIIELGDGKITFSSLGKEKNPSIKKYQLTSYFYEGIKASCTLGFQTGNIEITSIKNLPSDFICGSDISLAHTPPPSDTLVAPANFVVTDVTQTKIDIKWDGVLGATSYILRRDGTAIYTGNNTSFSDITLDADRTYEYTVAAKNETHTSAYATLSQETDAVPEAPPSPTHLPITNLRATNITENTVELAWDNPPDLVEIGFYNNGEEGASGYPESETVIIKTLTPDTVYTFSLIAKYYIGNSEPATITVKTLSDSKNGIISAGEQYSIILKSDGTIMTWGNNSNGHLGDGTTTQRNTPVQVNGFLEAKYVSAGGAHSISVKNEGTVWTWGYNSNGQLGDGTVTQQNIPLQVSGLTDIKSGSAGNLHTVALKNDGTVWAWGSNAYGQLGDGTVTQQNTPVQVSGLMDVESVSSGNHYNIALKKDGTVWAWGSNGSGQLGDGTMDNKNTPVQVFGLTNVKSISAGNFHNMALKNDGTVWAWGVNTNGQLGDGTYTNSNFPVQVSDLTDVKSVSAGGYHTIALKNDGTVWAWGYNGYGQLGDGTIVDKNSPIKVTQITDVTSISGGGHHTLALKSDSTVWAWGRNNAGQLGDRTTTSRRIPVQVKNSDGSIFTQ